VLVREDASAFLAGVQVELVRLYAQHGAVDASRGSERKQAPVCLSASKGLSLCVRTDEENGKDRKLVALGVTMQRKNEPRREKFKAALTLCLRRAGELDDVQVDEGQEELATATV
jgi:hypothetical protein